ncbi:MAG: hypothetical protein QM820_09715 [Minicystis sp.]
MRADMFEIIIERPRYGGSWGGLKGRRRERPDLLRDSPPAWQPVSRGRGTKHLNENLAPLHRFLASRAGRPWDDVRSEICALIQPRSAVQKHVLDHVREMVEENPVIIDGRPFDPVGHGPRRDRYNPLGRRWHGAFYVCPRTRRLLVARLPPREQEAPDPDRKTIDRLREARRIDGVWYLVTFAELPVTYAEQLHAWDVIARAQPASSEALRRAHGFSDRYAVAKKQLSTREIREYVGEG